jgi:hypothetical protein
MIDLTGRTFGRLTVLGFSHRGPGRRMYWTCRCLCGAVRKIQSCSLRSGASKSCGCYREQIMRLNSLTHGGIYTRLYRTWQNMISRCTYPSQPNYAWYGAKGITVCPSWRHDFAAFRCWALANNYTDQLSIDRIDSEGNYEPSNCRWITRSENSRLGALAYRAKRRRHHE